MSEFSFLFMLYEIPLWHISHIHLFPDGYLSCFDILVLQILLLWMWEYKYLFETLLSIYGGSVPRCEIVGSHGNSIINFVRTHTCLIRNNNQLSEHRSPEFGGWGSLCPTELLQAVCRLPQDHIPGCLSWGWGMRCGYLLKTVLRAKIN